MGDSYNSSVGHDSSLCNNPCYEPAALMQQSQDESFNHIDDAVAITFLLKEHAKLSYLSLHLAVIYRC